MLLGNNHLENIFAEVTTIKTLFASGKPLAIADCRGESVLAFFCKYFISPVRKTNTPTFLKRNLNKYQEGDFTSSPVAIYQK